MTNDIDPKIKRLFPWGLFLTVAVILATCAMLRQAHGEPYACFGSGRYAAMSDGITCDDPRAKSRPYYFGQTEFPPKVHHAQRRQGHRVHSVRP